MVTLVFVVHPWSIHVFAHECHRTISPCVCCKCRLNWSLKGFCLLKGFYHLLSFPTNRFNLHVNFADDVFVLLISCFVARIILDVFHFINNVVLHSDVFFDDFVAYCPRINACCNNRSVRFLILSILAHWERLEICFSHSFGECMRLYSIRTFRTAYLAAGSKWKNIWKWRTQDTHIHIASYSNILLECIDVYPSDETPFFRKRGFFSMVNLTFNKFSSNPAAALKLQYWSVKY